MKKCFSRYKDTPKYITNLARGNRVNPTAQEEKLWSMISGKKLNGLKFRRQFPVGRYIVDFYHHPNRLVIEVDGSVHKDTKGYDRNRDAYLQAYGCKILRFTNSEIESQIDRVIQQILENTLSPPAGDTGGEKQKHEYRTHTVCHDQTDS
jgi:very-short-patch-repair endonuclease